MTLRTSQLHRINARLDAEIKADPFAYALANELRKDRAYFCAGCGTRFATKGEKRRHKAECGQALTDFEPFADQPCADEDLYSRSHSNPEIRARAAAEWEAMDWRGELPPGWEYRPENADTAGRGLG